MDQLILTALKLETTYLYTHETPTTAPAGRTSPGRGYRAKDANSDTVITSVNAFNKKKKKFNSSNSFKLGETRKRATWATSEEMQKRKAEGYCLRCGKQGHIIGQCRLARAQPPKTQVQATSVLQVEELSLEEESTTESEN